MLNPIKRVWTPKPQATKDADANANPPDAEVKKTEAQSEVPHKRGVLYAEIPEPEVEERATESVWAAFNSVLPMDELTKPR